MERPEKKRISVIGSTGSIGRQSLDVAAHLDYEVTALAAGRNAALLEEQIRAFRPKVAALYDKEAARDLKIKVADTGTKILSGMEGVRAAAAEGDADLVIVAVVGMIGIEPTVAAINAGKTVGLANKESLVCGGELVTGLAKEKNVKIIPIDSEHSAVFQSLQGAGGNKINKIILTASGGPFFGKTRDELKDVTPEKALKHPNWSMGAKITIDSSTLVNKGLEFIEAYWLFGVKPSQIEIVIHRESILHSAVEFEDGSVIAQMGVPDMRVPIQYAVTYPRRLPSPAARLSLTDVGPDFETFKGRKAFTSSIETGGTMPAALNAANEEAVSLFLEGKIGYNDISDIICDTLASHRAESCDSVEKIFAVTDEVKSRVRRERGAAR